MTVGEIIARVDALVPNQYETAEKVRWLWELDGKLAREVICWHERPAGPSRAGAGVPPARPTPGWKGGEADGEGEWTFAGYGPEGGLERELLAGPGRADLYIAYLTAQMDYHNGELARYNNSMVVYNMALSEYANWYNRTHRPKAGAVVRLSL